MLNYTLYLLLVDLPCRFKSLNMSDLQRSLVASVFDALPSESPDNWDDPPAHVAPDFAAATQSERALTGLMAARDLVITDPEKLVGKLNLSEGAKRMKMSHIFENAILICRLPPSEDLLYLFKTGSMFDFRADSPFIFFGALWKLHVGYSRSSFSTLVYPKPEWRRAKRVVSDPSQFSFACQHLDSLLDNVADLIAETKVVANSSFDTWTDEEKEARQWTWPSDHKVILSVPPLRITIDQTFLDCANMNFRDWFDSLTPLANSFRLSAKHAHRMMSLMACQDAFQHFWTAYEMLRLGKSRPSVDQVSFSLKCNLARIRLNSSFMDQWLKNAMSIKKLPKPASWMQSLKRKPS